MINHILLLSGQVGVGDFLLPWWVMQELEKFKFVLDYKIKELKKKIEPKEEQIADMKDQVKVRCAVLCCAVLVKLLALAVDLYSFMAGCCSQPEVYHHSYGLIPGCCAVSCCTVPCCAVPGNA